MSKGNGSIANGGTEGAEQSVRSKKPDILYVMRQEAGLQDEIRSGIGYLHGLTRQLEDQLHSLPKVDENEWSECPFAEQLYVAKAELEREVDEKLQDVLAKKPSLTQLIKKRHQRVTVVRADRPKLNSAEAKQMYDGALHDARRELEITQNLLRDLEDACSRAKQVVAQAHRMIFAGKECADEAASSASLSGSSLLSALVAEDRRGGKGTESGRKEIESLLSIGPIGF